MTAQPINLAALRERYEMAAANADRAGEAFERDLWQHAIALIDTAEAAREYYAVSLPVMRGVAQFRPPSAKRLEAALARFTFEQP